MSDAIQSVLLQRHGGLNQLQFAERPAPTTLADDAIQVQVAYCGVNFADILTRLGLYAGTPPTPFVPGLEISGRIEQVGSAVTQFRPGQSVAALLNQGGYASRVQLPASQAIPVPDGIALDAAAALPVNYLTAWFMLFSQANLQPGEQVLVHAAGGGVGLAVLQLCLWHQATVIGTASASKHKRLYEAGITHCIDYRSQDFEKAVMAFTGNKGVDVGLDAVGGASYRKSYRCLAPMGRLIAFGASSFTGGDRRNWLAILKGLLNTPRFNPLRMISESKLVAGFHLAHMVHYPDKMAHAWENLCALTAAGQVEPVIDSIFPLEDADKAHAYLQARRNFGKVLLRP